MELYLSPSRFPTAPRCWPMSSRHRFCPMAVATSAIHREVMIVFQDCCRGGPQLSSMAKLAYLQVSVPLSTLP